MSLEHSERQKDVSWFGRYSLGAVVTLLAVLVVRAGHVSRDPAAAYSVLLAAVMLSSWLGGLGPGLVSTFLGTLAADFFIFAPVKSIDLDATRIIQLSAFVSVALLISSLNDARRRASASLEAERTRLEEDVQTRTANLSRAERNFRGLIESAPDAIVAIDETGRIAKVNAETERMFGYARGRLLGADVRTIIPERFRERHLQARRQYHRDSTTRTIAGDLFGRRADGSEVPVDIRVSALESDEGLLIVGVIRDVSERYNAQREQQRLVHDLGERVKELTALHAIARILNEDSTPPLLLARIVEVLRPAWQYPEVTQARIVVGTEEVATGDFRLTKWVQRSEFKTAEQRAGAIEVVYIEERPEAAEGPFLAEERTLIDSIAELLCAYFERRHAEESRLRLARAEASATEAEHASRAKDQFIATLSHELRSPLNVMLGWTRMMRSGTLDADGTGRGLAVLDRSVRLQSRLIDDLLDVSRIVTGKLRVERQRVDLGAIAQVAVDAARPAADAKNIRLTSDIDGPLWMDADPARLQQIISNVLTNALKFTGPAGHVSVRASGDDTRARVVISDNGIGMGPDLLPFVFERFRQGDSSTTRSHGGLGLGLAIVKRLIELHGGKIEVFSPGPGKGSTFTIALPLAVDSGVAEAAKTAPPNNVLLTGIRVLVVDDDADARLTVTTLLEQFGATATAVASASEAFEALAHDHVDVVLSDLAMPGQDGYEMMRRIRRDRDVAELPAAALTAYADADCRSRALAAGFQEHLAKPVEPGVLTATLARLVHRA
jgi:PAS domain S-box-containing protein